MSLSDIVSISIVATTRTPTQAGFGTPLLAAYHTLPNPRVREFSSLAEAVDAGFTAAAYPAIYRALSSAFSQNPRPETIKVGRRDLAPTQTIRLTPTVTTEGFVYTLSIDDNDVTYTVQASDTVALIIDGLKTAIDALSLGLTTTDNATSLDVAADTAGELHKFDGRVKELELEDRTTDPGIATDLGEIRVADPDWYGLALDSTGPAEAEAAAAWAETQDILFVAEISNDEAKDAAVTDDAASNMADAEYARTVPVYTPDVGTFLGFGGLAEMLTYEPGEATWAFKTVRGASPYTLTSTEKSALEGKNVSTYTTIAGTAVLMEGKTASGEWADVTRFIDWLRARMQERIFALFLANPKLPYTAPGADAIIAEIEAQLDAGIAVGGLAADPEPIVTRPAISAISSTDKNNRLLPDVEFTATLAGAIHATTISGTLSV